MKSLGIIVLSLLFLGSLQIAPVLAQGKYRNFAVSVYARVYEVRQMGDLSWLEPRRSTSRQQFLTPQPYSVFPPNTFTILKGEPYA